MYLQITQLLNPSIILIRLQNFMEFFKNFNTNFNAKSIRWLEFISLLTKIIKELYSCLTWWVALKVCLIFLACLQWMYPMQKFLKVYELFLWNHHSFLIWPAAGIYLNCRCRIVIIFCLLLTKSKNKILV